MLYLTYIIVKFTSNSSETTVTIHKMDLNDYTNIQTL